MSDDLPTLGKPQSSNVLQSEMYKNIDDEDNRPSVGIDARQTTQMLTHLLEIVEARLLSTQQLDHATQRGALQHFAAIERVYNII